MSKRNKEEFHLISEAQNFQRKMQRKGYSTKRKIVGTPQTGYGAEIHFWKKAK